MKQDEAHTLTEEINTRYQGKIVARYDDTHVRPTTGHGYRVHVTLRVGQRAYTLLSAADWPSLAQAWSLFLYPTEPYRQAYGI